MKTTKEKSGAVSTGMTRRDMLAAVGAGSVALGLGHSAQAKTASSSVKMVDGLVTTPKEAIVTTQAGKVRGFKRGDVYIHKGIPYGADTSGANRFMPPRPVKPWTDVRLTLLFGQICPQPGSFPTTPDFQRFAMDEVFVHQGEDCLCLNVWSTNLNRNAKMPVMVWLHGGGFTTGCGHETPAYDGESLARHGVVVVTLNHRLGPFGFLNLSTFGESAKETSPNAGMLDLVAALQWVRDNIEAFGGDPSCVTIFGQSGGGGKVSTLMAMPSAKGLFHRAIVMSGSFPAASRRSDELAAATVSELGIASGDLRSLQSVDAARLLAASNAGARRLSPPGGDMFAAPRFSPFVDGVVLPEAWEKSAPSISAHIPMIIGNVRDEFRRIPLSFDEQSIANAIPPPRRDKVKEIVAAMRAAYPKYSLTDLGAIIGGMTLRSSAIEQARKKDAQKSAPVFMYWYTWANSLLDGQYGVPHGADIPGAFDNAHRADTLTGNTPEVREVAKKMSNAFVAFARSGDPSVPGLKWPRFDGATIPTMIFDTPVRVENDPAGAARKLLEG